MLAIWFEGAYSLQIPLGLVQGRATTIVWPPQRICQVERRILQDRFSPSAWTSSNWVTVLFLCGITNSQVFPESRFNIPLWNHVAYLLSAPLLCGFTATKTGALHSLLRITIIWNIQCIDNLAKIQMGAFLKRWKVYTISISLCKFNFGVLYSNARSSEGGSWDVT